MAMDKCRQWGIQAVASAGLVSLFSFSMPVIAEQSAFSCDDLTSLTEPASAQEWLVLSKQAGHCYDFQARAVSIDALGVRTLALSHRIRDGIRQQVVQHLDGPSVSVERQSAVGYRARFIPEDRETGSAAEAWAAHVAHYYEIELLNDDRVAGREAVQLKFVPQDGERYQHEWWLDRETGLLLKHVMRDSQSRALETFQITQLQSPVLYEGVIANPASPEEPAVNWQAEWLPDGFVSQPVETSSLSSQRVYSDGLASVSLFAAPVEQQALSEGSHQLGVSTATVSVVEVDDQRWQLVGVGELPAAVIRRIVQSIVVQP
ncbi:MAG: MucB/RseB C-terminal domain-containing protein [Halomonas sp.]|nr:MucB/RseB C-terminal domain-containing protein [Halomonas sp.]MDM7483021.1 MucB/RseB C-terminal domain-containing protein [Halomonas sp.]